MLDRVDHLTGFGQGDFDAAHPGVGDAGGDLLPAAEVTAVDIEGDQALRSVGDGEVVLVSACVDA